MPDLPLRVKHLAASLPDGCRSVQVDPSVGDQLAAPRSRALTLLRGSKSTRPISTAMAIFNRVVEQLGGSNDGRAVCEGPEDLVPGV